MPIGSTGWFVIIVNFFKGLARVIKRVFRRSEARVSRRKKIGKDYEDSKKSGSMRDHLQSVIDAEKLRDK